MPNKFGMKEFRQRIRGLLDADEQPEDEPLVNKILKKAEVKAPRIPRLPKLPKA